MAMRCSLLGHDYGSSEIEQEREERGSEVVLTVLEYEECSRCGDRNVISENTEVTSLATEPEDGTPPAADSAPQTPPETDSTANASPDTARSPPGDESDSHAEILDDEASSTASTDADSIADREQPADSSTGSPAADSGAPEHPSGQEGDGAEILDDDERSADADRGRGEWPESDDVGPPEGAETESSWPESESPTATDADNDPEATTDSRHAGGSVPESTPASEDATIIDDGPAHSDGSPAAGDDSARSVDTAETSAGNTTSSVESTPVGESNTAGESTTAETTADDSSEPVPETGFTSAGSAPAPGTGPSHDDGASELYCPRCSFVARQDRGSLRTGDICPECRKGYLGERPDSRNR